MSQLSVIFTSVCLILAVLTSACGAASAKTFEPTVPNPTAASMLPTEQSAAASPEPKAAATVTSAPSSIWLPDYLPQALHNALKLPGEWKEAQQPAQAVVSLDVVTGQETAASYWIYALAAPFPTVQDDQSLEELKGIWRATKDSILPIKTLLVDPSTRAIFEKLWGTAGSAVKTMDAKKLAQYAWNDKDKATWAIVPFEALNPRWKVLSVDGQSPVRKDFELPKYGLAVSFGFKGGQQAVAELDASSTLPESNRDPALLTTVVVTGVTALVRGTASLMEGMGMTYPARDIGPWLREADILHVSNEVPFARNCPQPFDWKELVFCSQTEYIQLLEDVGTDVVELTGDHFADWGADAMLYTLDLYKERGWKYYGGGANLKEAQLPALFEHNGNKIAFLGCNGKEPGYATAGVTIPGAGHCDFDELTARIKEVRAQGYLPIVTFQHLEYYQYIALPELQVDFHKVSAAGAVIVSGSQAHQPHAFEYRDGAFIHYGLGNLFFDQTNQGDPPRTAFIDRHVFYAGQHISTELLTIYLVDYARSRPMTGDERRQMLEEVFKASGW